MTDFKRFEVTHNGITYISEFDFEALKLADEMKVMGMGSSPMNMTYSIFYCSVLKNHPYVNQRKLREFYDDVLRDEEYGINAFEEIVEEFVNHFLEFVDSKGKKAKKRFTASAPAATVVNYPKAEE